MILLKTLRPRSMMSTCPFVIGSKDPGYTALVSSIWTLS